MTPEQVAQVMSSLGRIEQKIDGHVDHADRLHQTHDDAIKSLYSKANEQDRFRSRVKGVGATLGTIFTAIIALIGLDY